MLLDSAELDLASPVDWGHPENVGRRLWYFPLPSGSRNRLTDLVTREDLAFTGDDPRSTQDLGTRLHLDQYGASYFYHGLSTSVQMLSRAQPFTGSNFTLCLRANLYGVSTLSPHRTVRFRNISPSLQANGTAFLGFVLDGTAWVTSARARVLNQWERIFITRSGSGTLTTTMWAANVVTGEVSSIASSTSNPAASTSFEILPAMQAGTTNNAVSDISLYDRVLSVGEMNAISQRMFRGYRTPDSPMRFVRGTAFSFMSTAGGTPTTITPAPLTLRITPVAPAVHFGTTIAAPALTQRLTPVAPTVRVGTTLTPPPLSLRVSPVAPSIRVGTTIAPSPITQRITLVAPAVRVGTRIAPPPLVLRLTPVAPAVSAGVAGETNVHAPTLTLRITLIAPALRVGTRITPPPLVQRLSVVAPTVRVGTRIVPPSLAQQIALVAPSVRVGTRIGPPPLALRLSLRAPQVSIGGIGVAPRMHRTLTARFKTNAIVADYLRNTGLKAEQRTHTLIAKYPR